MASAVVQSIVRNGIDYSAGWPAGEHIRSAGFDFACRYLSEDWRALTIPERDSLTLNKVDLVIIGEYDRVDDNGNQISAMLRGFAGGVADARYADSLRAALALPERMPIYATLDVEPGSVAWSDVGAYLDGWASVVGKERVGLYGGFDAIEWYVNVWGGQWPWQTYAWSRGLLHAAAKIYQYDNYGEYVAGINVDLNKAFVTNFGQATMFLEDPVPQIEWAIPAGPDWFASSLSVRWPSVGYWTWNDQKLTLRVLRCNAGAARNTNQYAEPTTASGHAGPMIPAGSTVHLERHTTIETITPAGKKRYDDWLKTDAGTWIPERALTLDFTIRPRRKKS